jgi:FKBP-type peptidyl-prolyl cis-trans isomerase FklB
MKKSSFMILCVSLTGIPGVIAVAQTDGAKSTPPAATASQSSSPASAPELKNDKERISYALGMRWANNLRDLRHRAVDFDQDLAVQGMLDSLAGGKTRLTEDERAAVLGKLQKDLEANEKGKSAETRPASVPELKMDKEKVSYALGMRWAIDLKDLRSKSVDFDPDLIVQGMQDSLAGRKTRLTEDERFAILSKLHQDLVANEKKRLAETNLKEGETFLAANKAKEGVVTLPSGLEYKVLTQGTGPKPTANDTVVCNYRGTFIDGKEFDSSYRRGQPSTFPVAGVIRGWTEALQLMPVGSKWQLFIPPSLAYGEMGHRQDIQPNATLIFEVELLSIKPKENAQTK